jgi:hypothetical protein
MSILRVANVQFNASGTRRIDYDATNDDGIIKISADAIKLPVGDTASRPNSQAGMIRYNSDTGYVEFGSASAWTAVASNGAYDVANAAFNMANVAYNAQNVDYTLSNTAFSVANAAFGKANVALTGVVPVANGGTGLSSLASASIPYGNGTGAFSSSANLSFDGTYFWAGNIRINGYDSDINQIFQRNYGANLGLTANGGNIIFGQTSSEKMRLTPSGRLGIQQTNPQQMLHVGTGSNAQGLIGDVYFYDDGQCHIHSTNSKSLYLNSQPTAVLRLNEESAGHITMALGGGNVVIGTTSTGAGKLAVGGTVGLVGTVGTYSLDVTGAATSIANGGTVGFRDASGLLIVNSYTTGWVTMWLCGGGTVVNVGQVSGTVGSFAYTPGNAGYTWTNNSGSTQTIGFFFVRTRSTA